MPPGWKGAVPTDAKRLDVSTNKVWLWGRLRIAQGEPVESVLELQKKFKLEPASGNAKSPMLPPLPATKGDELGFLKELAFALKSRSNQTGRCSAIWSVCADRPHEGWV
ncbi:DUF1254 domain-containing protein [Bradyrhizobium sp. TZ2]